MFRIFLNPYICSFVLKLLIFADLDHPPHPPSCPPIHHTHAHWPIMPNTLGWGGCIYSPTHELSNHPPYHPPHHSPHSLPAHHPHHPPMEKNWGLICLIYHGLLHIVYPFGRQKCKLGHACHTHHFLIKKIF